MSLCACGHERALHHDGGCRYVVIIGDPDACRCKGWVALAPQRDEYDQAQPAVARRAPILLGPGEE